MQRFEVLIVGAGHGGAHAAVQLRQLSFAGSLAVIGEEPELPYERPPLSKDFLAGDKEFERMLLRPESFWAERGVAMLTGRRVDGVDATARTVATDRGETIGYGDLIWAAGGAPRKLACEGHDLAGIHAIRTRADVGALKAELSSASRIAIVGGGYIGLETAAVLSKLGKQVTVLEAMDRVLARVAGPDLSNFYEAEHRAHGVTVRTGEMVAAISGKHGRADGVIMTLNNEMPAIPQARCRGVRPAATQAVCRK